MDNINFPHTRMLYTIHILACYDSGKTIILPLCDPLLIHQLHLYNFLCRTPDIDHLAITQKRERRNEHRKTLGSIIMGYAKFGFSLKRFERGPYTANLYQLVYSPSKIF